MKFPACAMSFTARSISMNFEMEWLAVKPNTSSPKDYARVHISIQMYSNDRG